MSTLLSPKDTLSPHENDLYETVFTPPTNSPPPHDGNIHHHAVLHDSRSSSRSSRGVELMWTGDDPDDESSRTKITAAFMDSHEKRTDSLSSPSGGNGGAQSGRSGSGDGPSYTESSSGHGGGVGRSSPGNAFSPSAPSAAFQKASASSNPINPSHPTNASLLTGVTTTVLLPPSQTMLTSSPSTSYSQDLATVNSTNNNNNASVSTAVSNSNLLSSSSLPPSTRPPPAAPATTNAGRPTNTLPGTTTTSDQPSPISSSPPGGLSQQVSSSAFSGSHLPAGSQSQPAFHSSEANTHLSFSHPAPLGSTTTNPPAFNQQQLSSNSSNNNSGTIQYLQNFSGMYGGASSTTSGATGGNGAGVELASSQSPIPAPVPSHSSGGVNSTTRRLLVRVDGFSNQITVARVKELLAELQLLDDADPRITFSASTRSALAQRAGDTGKDADVSPEERSSNNNSSPMEELVTVYMQLEKANEAVEKLNGSHVGDRRLEAAIVRQQNSSTNAPPPGFFFEPRRDPNIQNAGIGTNSSSSSIGGGAANKAGVRPARAFTPEQQRYPPLAGGGGAATANGHSAGGGLLTTSFSASYSPIVYRLRGLPFSSRDEDVSEFVRSVQGVLNVSVCRCPEGRCTGDAFVELASQESVAQLRHLHGKMMGPRYIEVIPSTPHDRSVIMRSAASKGRHHRNSANNNTNNNNNSGGANNNNHGGAAVHHHPHFLQQSASSSVFLQATPGGGLLTLPTGHLPLYHAVASNGAAPPATGAGGPPPPSATLLSATSPELCAAMQAAALQQQQQQQQQQQVHTLHPYASASSFHPLHSNATSPHITPISSGVFSMDAPPPQQQQQQQQPPQQPAYSAGYLHGDASGSASGHFFQQAPQGSASIPSPHSQRLVFSGSPGFSVSPPQQQHHQQQQQQQQSSTNASPRRAGAVIRVSGLPLHYSELVIAQTLNRLRILPEGVHLVINEMRQPTGDALVELQSPEDAEIALSVYHGQRLGDQHVLSVYRTAVDISTLPPPATVLPPPQQQQQQQQHQAQGNHQNPNSAPNHVGPMFFGSGPPSPFPSAAAAPPAALHNAGPLYTTFASGPSQQTGIPSFTVLHQTHTAGGPQAMNFVAPQAINGPSGMGNAAYFSSSA